jgi:large subunit ribosomal protein L18
MNKKSRQTRSKKTRNIIKSLGAIRLTVHRTSKHIYAQIINSSSTEVLACANTLQQNIDLQLSNTGNIVAAKAVGKVIAERAISVGIVKVAFDRSGFKYHGRVKALADAAREAGLNF